MCPIHSSLLWTGEQTFVEIENKSETRSEIMGSSKVKLPRLSHESVSHSDFDLLTKSLSCGEFQVIFPLHDVMVKVI